MPSIWEAEFFHILHYGNKIVQEFICFMPLSGHPILFIKQSTKSFQHLLVPGHIINPSVIAFPNEINNVCIKTSWKAKDSGTNYFLAIYMFLQTSNLEFQFFLSSIRLAFACNFPPYPSSFQHNKLNRILVDKILHPPLLHIIYVVSYKHTYIFTYINSSRYCFFFWLSLSSLHLIQTIYLIKKHIAFCCFW